MNPMAQIYYTDEDELLSPLWTTQPRGFVDTRTTEDQELEGLLDATALSDVGFWVREEDGWTFELKEVTLKASHRCVTPIVVTAASSSMPRRFLDSMRIQLREIAAAFTGKSSVEYGVMLLQLIEGAVGWIQEWKPPTEEAGKGWSSKGTDGWKTMLDNARGVDLSTIDDVAEHLLQKPIDEICEDIPKWLRILHVEPVFRKDLADRFLKRQVEVERELLGCTYTKLRSSVSPKAIPYGSSLDSREGLAKELSRPSVTFHGAPRNVVSSIVRHGFVKPGDRVGGGKKLDVRCGVAFGKGVYSSPDPIYASGYTRYTYGEGRFKTMPGSIPGMRLIVCAVLMGLPLQVDVSEARGATEALNHEAHSHVSPDKLQYLVFDTKQIIPCYVLHLDYGAERARDEFQRLPNDPNDWVRQKQKEEKRRKANQIDEDALFPGHIAAQKEALKAAATKWFPYGYGPAKGTNFVIEEVGYVSDDEEIYGDFQGMRIETEHEIREHEERVERGGSWFDEYQTVRKANKKLPL